MSVVMSVETRTHHDVQCPRCGYDLHGLIETWKHECPITGVCSECGLEFEWGELLNPARNVPAWCLEYAQGVCGGMICAVRTLGMMLRPWRFWRELKMIHQPRWRPFVRMHVCLLVGVYFVFLVALGLAVATDWMWTITFSPSVTRWELVGRTMLFPLSSKSPGVWGTFNQPINSPLDYSMMLFTFLKDMWLIEIVYMGYLLLCAVGFLALPQSRRIAKVKWIHVHRICAYSTFQYWLLIYTIILFGGSEADTEIMSVVRVLLLSLVIGLFVFPILWWSLAASRYLKMRHPWGIGLALCVLAFLCALFLLAIVLAIFGAIMGIE